MSGRIERLLERLPGLQAEAILVTSLVNLRYLTGFTGSSGLAVIGPDIRLFVTDFRYEEQSAAEVDGGFERVIAPRELFAAAGEHLPESVSRLAFEDTHLTVKQHGRLSELLDDRVGLVAAGETIEALRAIKEPGEIERIRAASQLADEALREVMEQGFVGRTEREVALAMERAMRDRGAQRLSFDTIIAAGPHGALPHAQPRDVAIGAGELVVVDWGAELDGYCSDCTRTLATGEISDEARQVYELVLEAQLASLQAVRAGAGGQEVDGVARQIIAAAGHGEHFGHGLGHGVGLEVHEAPTLSFRAKDTLAVGNIVTVEPGVYLPGQLGVRIEDLVVVTADGPEILTGLSKELTDVA
jgi:Xaa-Pro aminopeptidase